MFTRTADFRIVKASSPPFCWDLTYRLNDSSLQIFSMGESSSFCSNGLFSWTPRGVSISDITFSCGNFRDSGMRLQRFSMGESFSFYFIGLFSRTPCVVLISGSTLSCGNLSDSGISLHRFSMGESSSFC